MTIKDLVRDLIARYMLLGPYWQLFTYIMSIFFMRALVYYAKKKGICTGKTIMAAILFFYLITIYTSTVLSRQPYPGRIVYLHPFLSWKSALSGNKSVIMEVVENIFMLMPMGVMMPFILENKYYSQKLFLGGFLFSLFIEISQYITGTGYFEVDDLINNTLGVIIGYYIAMFIKYIKRF